MLCRPFCDSRVMMSNAVSPCPPGGAAWAWTSEDESRTLASTPAPRPPWSRGLREAIVVSGQPGVAGQAGVVGARGHGARGCLVRERGEGAREDELRDAIGLGLREL